MSASNWAVCPKCLDGARAEHHLLNALARYSYGKVPVEEFDELRRRAEKGVDKEDFRTFREDYEFYIDEGQVVASYGGGCDKCHLEVSFTHRVPFYEPTPFRQADPADSALDSDEHERGQG